MAWTKTDLKTRNTRLNQSGGEIGFCHCIESVFCFKRSIIVDRLRRKLIDRKLLAWSVCFFRLRHERTAAWPRAAGENQLRNALVRDQASVLLFMALKWCSVSP